MGSHASGYSPLQAPPRKNYLWKCLRRIMVLAHRYRSAIGRPRLAHCACAIQWELHPPISGEVFVHGQHEHRKSNPFLNNEEAPKCE
jgi:hypothetical protein